MKTVEIFSYATHTKRTIPASELGPNMIRTTIEGVGTVFVETTEVPRRSPTTRALPDGFDRLAGATLAVIKLCVDWTDESGWVELLGWMKLACVFHELTHGETDAPAIQRDVFKVCLQAWNNGELALETVELSRISRARARVCMQRMLALPKEVFADFWARRLSESECDILVRFLRLGDD
jgi:hypothetical protein